MEPNSPCSEGPAEDVDALLLKDSHHLSLEVSFRLAGIMVTDQGLESTRTNLCVVESICISILSLFQSIDDKGTHDLHMSPEAPENTGSMPLRVLLHTVTSVIHKGIEMFNI